MEDLELEEDRKGTVLDSLSIIKYCTSPPPLLLHRHPIPPIMRLLGLQASHYNHGSIQDKIHRGRREKK
jgi:hypothetical protein